MFAHKRLRDGRVTPGHKTAVANALGRTEERMADQPALHRDAVISRIVARLRSDVPDWLAAHPIKQPTDYDTELSSADANAGGRSPLARLDRLDARLLSGIGLIEEDVRFGSLFAALQEPLPSRRPCVGLLGWLLADPEDDVADLHERIELLAARGLVEIGNPEDPRAEWVPRLPVPIWDLLRRGYVVASSLPPMLSYRPADSFPDLADVALCGEVAAAAHRLPDLILHGGLSALVLRGMDGSGRLTLLGATARAVGQGLLVHEGEPGDVGWRLLPALAELGDAFPATVAAPGPGETLRLPELVGLRRPLGVVLGRSGGLAGPPTERAVGFTLGACTPAERRVLWASSALAAPDEGEEIVSSFLLTPGNIHRAGRLAHATAAADGRATITASDVRTATRALQRQTLETLATRLDPLVDAAPPVLGATASDEVRTLLTRCRHREALAQSDGALRGTVNRGVRALFSGPSGTGKTLTARHLAAMLHLDVYRVDLAAVVNKYIGETERNLDQVLARAEELDVLLLLDEGDALMTKRTDVSNAVDRYANLETNFLLQRLETFDGIVVITTNAVSRIDTGFLRRIDVTIDFVPPDADQRWQLWNLHLPPAHEISPHLLTDIARRCDLTGGQIRNASLHARLLSLDQATPVSDGELMVSIAREYRRSGASFPLAGRLDGHRQPAASR
jgi:hypothetical protein